MPVADMSTLRQLSIIIPFAPEDMTWTALLSDLTSLPANSEIILIAGTESSKQDAIVILQSFIESKSGVFPAQAGTQRRWQLSPASLDPRLRGDDETRVDSKDVAVLITVIDSPCGRARQMNAGARAAKNSCLWFLHADSRVDNRCLQVIDDFDFSKKQMGYFSLGFQKDGPRRMGINSLGVWFRSRFLKIPFGDQGFVISKTRFEALGSFREDLSSAEDHAFIWSARKNGVQLKHLNARIKTSARKYAEHGWGKTTRLHLRETWRQARQFSRQEKPP